MLKSWKFGLFLCLLLHTLLLAVTFFKHPMFGEYSVRGPTNHEANIVHWDIYLKARENLGEKLLDIRDCEQCFFPGSYFRNPQLPNGFNTSYVQPIFFFSWDNVKYPIMFSDRIGAIPYLFAKIIKEKFGLRFSLNLIHWFIGIAVIWCMFLVVKSRYGIKVAMISSFLMATSIIHIVNNGNYIAKKFEPIFLWLFPLAFITSSRLKSFSFLFLSFLSVVFVKSTALFNLFSGLPFVTWEMIKSKKREIVWSYILSAIIGGVVLLVLSDYVFRGYIQHAEYLKEFAYFKIAIYDALLMVISPLKYLEFYFHIDNWFFPGSTYSPTPEELAAFDVEARLKGLGYLSYLLGFFFFLPVFLYKQVDFKKRYLSLYLNFVIYHIVIFYFAAHKFFTSSLYSWSILGLVFIINALLIVDLWEKLKRPLNYIFVTIFFGIHLFVLIDFIKLYNRIGPIPTFSYNLYAEMARDLEERKIHQPLMFFMSEMANIDNFSEVVRPIYIHNKIFSNVGDMFDTAKDGYILTQTVIDWYEILLPEQCTKEKILEEASKRGIAIKSIKEYNYRGLPTYWLFWFEHKDTSRFHNGPYKLSDLEYLDIFHNRFIFR